MLTSFEEQHAAWLAQFTPKERAEKAARYEAFKVKAAAIEAVYRIVEPTGDVIYDSGYGKLIVYRCWRGSSTYNSKEFSHLLDMVIQDAKENGVDFISEADRALLLEEWGQNARD